MNPTVCPSPKGVERLKALRIPAAAFTFFAGAYGVSAQPDYAPATWTPPACTKYYNSGNGHKLVVIHDMEGYYASTISYLNRCDTDASGDFNVATSVFYAVNGLKDSGSDGDEGDITQFVRESKYAWHARCWNTWSFGTEHEGFASNPAWYTDAMYVASSGLQRHLCDGYSIAKDRNHIIAHGEGQNSAWVTWMGSNLPSIDATCNTHTDPGAYWNWTYFMDLVKKTNVVVGRFWDLNGAIAGAGSTPTGTWDNTSTNWSSSSSGNVTTGVWGAIGDAVFAAGTDATNNYTVTVTGTQSVYSLRVNNANVIFSGGKLIFTGIGTYYSNYVAAGYTATFATQITGPGGPDKWGPGTVVYNSSNNPKGYFSLNEGTIAVGNNSALGTNKFVIGNSGGGNVVVFKAASATARTLVNDIFINALNSTFDTGGDLTFNGDVSLGTTVKTITVNNNSIFAAAVTNTGGITKAGTGTLTFNGSVNNTYSGATTVSGGTLKLQKAATFTAIQGSITVNTGGTLLLAASDQINNSSAMTLAGGIFNTATFDEQLGTLKVTGNSRIDLGGTGSILKFAASSGVSWTAGTTLTVTNWSGSINGGGAEQLFVGTTASGLTAGQVNQIKFVNPAGFANGTYSAKILATGEVVPVAVAPTITTQPQSQIVLLNSNALFSVVANGTSNLVYQWRFGGTNVAGATTSQLLLTNVALNQAGFYSVVITNIAGSVTSSNAQLSVYETAAPNVGVFGMDINGNLTLSISGVPGYNYVIEASTNLVEWNPVKTNVSPFNFTNANAGDPAQFYRAVYVP